MKYPTKEKCIKAFEEGKTKLDIRKLTDEEIGEYWRIDELLCHDTMPFLPTVGEVHYLIE